MLLSVRPPYAEAILAGAKRAEIRRQRPGIQPGSPVIIYATMPVGAVVGTATIGSVRDGSTQELWDTYHHDMGITHDEFDQYVSGLPVAYLLLLHSARRLTSPLTLADMRKSTSFRPPRSYRYLTQRILTSLVDGHPAGAELLPLLRGQAAEH